MLKIIYKTMTITRRNGEKMEKKEANNYNVNLASLPIVFQMNALYSGLLCNQCSKIEIKVNVVFVLLFYNLYRLSKKKKENKRGKGGKSYKNFLKNFPVIEIIIAGKY